MSENLINCKLNSNQTGFQLPEHQVDSGIKVSVAMITFNQEAYVEQAIESVLLQQFNFTIELVISDDYSSDNTRNILKKYKEKYPKIINLLLPNFNQGMHLNFMNTLAACRGQYIALLEGDDYWTSNLKLQKQIDFLDHNINCSICFHKVLCVYEDNSSKSYSFPDKKYSSYTSLEDLFLGNFMSTCSVVYRNRLFEEVPPWYFKLKVGDWPLHIFNAEHGSIGFIDETMGIYRIHQNGVWSMKKQADIIVNSIEVLRAIDMYFEYKYTSIIDFSIANWKFQLFILKSDYITSNEAISSMKTVLRNPVLAKRYLSLKRYLSILPHLIFCLIKI